MAGQFKNAPIGFKPGMRFKTALGWREVLTVRDGTAICAARPGPYGAFDPAGIAERILKEGGK